MRPYSMDLRIRALQFYRNTQCYAEVARMLDVSAEWVRQLVKRHNETGEIEPRSSRTKRVPFHIRHEAELRSAVQENHDLTLEALHDKLQLKVSISTLWTALQALKLSFKKNESPGRAAEKRGGRTTS